MKIIDTHAHLYADEFKDDISEVIDRAKQIGVDKILLPNIDSLTIDQLHSLTDSYPDYCIPMMGLHPTSVGANWKEELSILKEQFGKRTYIAVGEIGIDLYWDKTFEKEQKEAFEEQLRWSIEYDLPIAIHSRDAIWECIESVKRVGSEKLRGVFHSFGGTVEELNGILALQNFMLGINGVATFKNSTLSTVLKETDISHIIIETDSPYLSPMPYRGKRNESSYTIKVVEKLADIYGINPEEVGNITTENAKRLFRIEN